ERRRTPAPLVRGVLHRSGETVLTLAISLLLQQPITARFGQKETGSEADRVNEQTDQRRGVCHLRARASARHAPRQRRRRQRCGGANHAAADIRREALAGSSQVGGKYFRNVVAPETELRDRADAHREDAPLRPRERLVRSDQEYHREDNQSGYLKDPEERAPAQNSNRK